MERRQEIKKKKPLSFSLSEHKMIKKKKKNSPRRVPSSDEDHEGTNEHQHSKKHQLHRCCVFNIAVPHHILKSISEHEASR